MYAVVECQDNLVKGVNVFLTQDAALDYCFDLVGDTHPNLGREYVRDQFVRHGVFWDGDWTINLSTAVVRNR